MFGQIVVNTIGTAIAAAAVDRVRIADGAAIANTEITIIITTIGDEVNHVTDAGQSRSLADDTASEAEAAIVDLVPRTEYGNAPSTENAIEKL